MYQTVEIPFVLFGNRSCITAQQAAELPWVREFVERFPACFEYAPNREVWVFYPDGDAPSRTHGQQTRAAGDEP